MKLHSKIISRNADKERLLEVASLITVAIWRLEKRKKEKILQKPLDSCANLSVTAACEKIRR